MIAVGRFEMDPWDEGRRPLADEVDDAARRARYWDWSNAGTFEDDATRISNPGPGLAWAKLETPTQGDFEAKHMQHSIGYNFDHYSSMGDLFSLRENGVPVVTVLVVDGKAVHARRKENGSLGRDDLAILDAFLESRGLARVDAEFL